MWNERCDECGNALALDGGLCVEQKREFGAVFCSSCKEEVALW